MTLRTRRSLRRLGMLLTVRGRWRTRRSWARRGEEKRRWRWSTRPARRLKRRKRRSSLRTTRKRCSCSQSNTRSGNIEYRVVVPGPLDEFSRGSSLFFSPNMSFQPEPRAKRQRTTFLDNGKPDLNPAAPSQPDISSSRRPVYQPLPTSTAGPPHRAHEGPTRKRERVAVNGNYIGYYKRRRQVQHGELDDRLELVPKEWIRGKRVLDVGANAGEVSIELAQRFRAAEVVGVDIDPELTQQARRNGDFRPFFCAGLPALRLTPTRLPLVDLAWSRQAPIPRLIEDAKRLRRGEATSMAEDPSDSGADLTVEDSTYFPASLARMFGFLPHPRGLVRSYTESTAVSPRRNRRDPNYVEHLFFPENIVFETADWVNTPLQADRDGYDVIFAYVFPFSSRSQFTGAGS